MKNKDIVIHKKIKFQSSEKNNNANNNEKNVKENEIVEEKNRPSEITKSEIKNDEKLPNTLRTWYPLIVFPASAFIIGLISYFMGGTFIKLLSNKMPVATINNMWFILIWAVMQVVFGVATYIMWRHHERPKKEIQENLLVAIIMQIPLIIWPLFFFRLNLDITAVVIISILCIISIYMTYRYYNTCIFAGTLSLVYTLWIFYNFYINWGYILIKI